MRGLGSPKIVSYGLLVLAAIFAACQAETVEVTRVVEQEVTRVVTETIVEEGEQIEVTRIVTEEVVVEVPAEELRAEEETVEEFYCLTQFHHRLGLLGGDLARAILGSADLSGTFLQAADLRGAELGQANLSGADLSGADMRETNLNGATLVEADLRGADLTGASLFRANLIRARYNEMTHWPEGFDLASSGAIEDERISVPPSRPIRLPTTILCITEYVPDVGRRGGYLVGVALRGVDLSGMYLVEANLRSAILTSADLSGADLTGADLYGAQLGGANLGSAILEDTILTAATYDERTIWPEGFDPEAAGVILVD